MAAVTIHRDFGAQENKIYYCFHIPPFYLPWSDGTGCHDLSILIVEFQANFFTCLFHFIKRLLSSCSISVTRVVLSGYLRLLIFPPAILIPACDSSSLVFLMMSSAYKLNKQGDNTQPWHTPFPIWNQSVNSSMSSSNCCFLTCIQVSQEASQVVWYSHLFQNFPQFIVIHTVKGFGIVNKAEIDVLLKLSCFFHDPADVGNSISGSSAFSKTSLNIRKFTVHVLLKPGLENFEHYFTSVWVVSNSVRPYGQQPTRLLCPRNSLGKNTGVGSHFLLLLAHGTSAKMLQAEDW